MKSFQTAKSGLKFPKGKDSLVGVVKPDTHTSYLPGGKDEEAFDCFLKAVKAIKPDFIIDIGDFGEWSSVSQWEWKRVKRPPLRYVMSELRKDAEAVASDFRKMERVLPADCQKFVLEGNHDQWVSNFIDELDDKSLRREFDLQNLLGLRETGWKWFDHAKWIKFGDLYVSHGTAAKGVNHLRNMVLRLGQNVMYGHVHDLGRQSVPALGGSHTAYSVGSLCEADKSFLRGDMTNWTHGFCTLDINKNGTFQVHQIPIDKGRCRIPGRIIGSKS